MKDTLDRIKQRVLTELDAFHEAKRHAQAWANVSGKRIYIVRNNGRYFIADKNDLSCYHRSDIASKRARVAAIQKPISFSLPVDVEHAPVPWAV